MILLTDILKDVLLEAKTGREEGPIRPQVREAVENCIKNRWLCQLFYEGDRENVRGSRYVEIYLLGIRKETQTLQIRVWQYRGKTTTYNPGWCTLRLDRISQTAPITSATFDHPRPLYNPHDKHMSRIIMAVQFPGQGGANQSNIPNTPTPPGLNMQSPEVKQAADVLAQNVKKGKIDFDAVAKSPEFKTSKMKKLLNFFKGLGSKALGAVHKIIKENDN